MLCRTKIQTAPASLYCLLVRQAKYGLDISGSAMTLFKFHNTYGKALWYPYIYGRYGKFAFAVLTRSITVADPPPVFAETDLSKQRTPRSGAA